jgi:NAD(P)-dependent dehydrogenase (short-subunit alcohol dehydrogenase family)
MINLNSKVAIITGARRGIGFAIAKRLHQQGANVVLFDVDEKETLAAAQSFDLSGESALA